jgi:outer membrane protein assembly factor BamD (BamD/ComL family)
MALLSFSVLAQELPPAAQDAAMEDSPPPATRETYRLDEGDNWLLTSAPDPATPEGQLAMAQRTLVEGNPDRAKDLADRWIELYEEHPMIPLAYLIRGDARTAMGDEYEALFDYEVIARLYPGSDIFLTALQRELDIAKEYARGKNRKLWGLRIAGATNEAEELFIRIQERVPGSNLAEEAGMELGDFYFRRGQMTLAATAYELYLDNYPDSPNITKARRRLIAAHLASYKGPQWDLSGLYDARQRLREMKTVEPAAAEQLGADALIAAIDERAAEKLLSNAKWYLRTNDVLGAEFVIRRLVSSHPRSAAAVEALRMIPEMLARLPQSLVDEVGPMYAAQRDAVFGPPVDAGDANDG